MAARGKHTRGAQFDPKTADAAEIKAALGRLTTEELAALVERANREYWDEDAPTLPDPLYDRIVLALRDRAPEHPLLSAMGPSRPERPKQGMLFGTDAPNDASPWPREPPAARFGRAVRHRRPMLSLDKGYTHADLLAWAKTVIGDFVAMPKLDGLACSIVYDDAGQLVLAATRGSGEEGEDVTANVLEIGGIPRTIPREYAPLEVRGEVYMRLSVFSRWASEYSNPRNLAAGALKNKDAAKSRDFALSFFPYDVRVDRPDAPDHERDKWALLTRLGFQFDAADVRVIDREHLVDAYDDLSARRHALDYEIDGVVFRAASVREQARLGETGHHPRWSLAYKFQGDVGRTVLRDVEWSVSRTGRINPTATFDPVRLSGAMVTSATLHNLGRLRELDLSAGCTLEVSRRGGVIPAVERVVARVPGAAGFPLPNQCPACGSPVEIRSEAKAEFLWCTRPEACTQARLAALEHFAKVVDIEGFGPKVVAAAYERELLRDPSDYYRLTVEQLEQLPRLARKSAQNLVDAVAAKRRLPLSVFLEALAIEGLGNQNAKAFARALGSVAAVRAAGPPEITAIPGFGAALAESIVSGLAAQREVIDRLLSVVEVDESVVGAAGEATEGAGAILIEGPLVGRSVVFTGALERWTRETASELARRNGATVANAVNKSLDFLVIGRGKGEPSTKQKRAEELVAKGANIRVLGEDEFAALLDPTTHGPGGERTDEGGPG